MPRDVVPIEIRPSRPSDIFSIMRCCGNSTCARLLMKRLPATFTPAASSASISLNSAAGSSTRPLPMTAFFPGTQNAARNQLENVLLLADEDRVPRVVSALVARHDVEPIREQIDDFSLALVAPLGAEDDHVSHLCPNFLVYRQNH